MENNNRFKRLIYISILLGILLTFVSENGFLLYTMHVFHEYGRGYGLLSVIFYSSVILLAADVIYGIYLWKRAASLTVPKIKLFLITVASFIVSWYLLAALYEVIGVF